MSWKYVVVKMGIYEYPIIFPDKLVHADVARQVQMLLGQQLMDMGDPIKADRLASTIKTVSAGEIGNLDFDYVGGGSETLGIKSRPEDAQLIKLFDYKHGYVGEDKK